MCLNQWEVRYELIRKERIPIQLIGEIEEIMMRLDELEDIKNKKLSKSTNENVTEELLTIGTKIRKNKEIINSIIKEWD